ncbi:tripeptidyl peptidase A [Mycena maculata]|uniref:tripeptidyl-peptidase II n=1 Tax=Mycena maculata TaxID=230809 RepID=A0AAD7JV56_9AGAR|nr:tripeptidyl peptidase A [Mycena maculata]
MQLFLLPLFLLATFSVAVPATLTPQDLSLQVKESVLAPRAWTRLGRAPSEHSIHLRIALFQQDFLGLEKLLYEISDPDHRRYGAHMSKEEVEKFVAPRPSSLTLVDGWLNSHGIHQDDLYRSPAKDWLSVTIPIRLAEDLLGAEYYLWQHTSGDILVRATNYSLPQYLHSHVELIQPTTIFMRWNAMSPSLYPEDDDQTDSTKSVMAPSGSHVDPDCATRITLRCLMQLYNVEGYTPKATKKNAFGITGFLDQYANLGDLKSYYRQQLPAAVNSSFKSISVYGGLNTQTPSMAGEEANLDTQFGFGMAYPTPGTFWSTPGSPPFFPDLDTPVSSFVQWLDYILNSEHIPQTISTSYGDEVALVELRYDLVPFTYASRVCKRFAELGCRGVSLLMASGDGGVGDGDPIPATQQCLTNDEKNRTRFIPAFPGSCPYITSVGGTMNIGPEISANFSGGGFSDYFPRPAYQDKAVGQYLTKLRHGTYDGLYNRNGRGIPDVSAQSRRFQIYWQGAPISIGGTSAATPTFAGIVALLNDARLAKGRAPLGFLNPLLYKRGAHALTDIVAGNNPGCGTPGFNATEGWDPVTGLGTPDFEALMKICI